MFFLKELPTREMLQSVSGVLAGADPDAMLAALRALRRASLRLRAIEGFLASQGLSQTQFLVLTVIIREPDRDSLSAAEVANRLDISRPVLSKVLATMERNDLIERKPDKTDGRRLDVIPTEAGREKFEASVPGYCAALLAPLEGD